MDLLTIKEISRELEVPESNLRYYRDRFEDFLPSVGEGRKRRYKKEALKVFQFIVKAFQNDKTTDQIAEELPKHFPRKLDFATQDESPWRQLLPQAEEQSPSSVFQLLQSQARTLERFSRLLFAGRDPAETFGDIKSNQQRLKRGFVLLNRDVQSLKSSLDNNGDFLDRCHSLEEKTETLQDQLQTTQKRLLELEERYEQGQRELREALQECLHLMRQLLVLDQI